MAEKFNMKDYTYSLPNHIIKIDNGNYDLTMTNIIKLWTLRIYNREKYNNNIQNIIAITVIEEDFEKIDILLRDE